MIAVDTNFVIRFLTHDDAEQFDRSYKLFKEHDVFICDSVILESEWVLRYAYEFAPDQICAALTRLFGLPNLHLANPVAISRAIDWHRQGLDFADALHVQSSTHCEEFLSFDDRRFAQRAARQGVKPPVKVPAA